MRYSLGCLDDILELLAVQSMSLMNGYDAADNFWAAASMAGSLLCKAAGVSGTDGVIGLALTTSLNSINAAYAFLASSAFTPDIRNGGTSELTRPEMVL